MKTKRTTGSALFGPVATYVQLLEIEQTTERAFLRQVRACLSSSPERSVSLAVRVQMDAGKAVAEELESVQAIFPELEIGPELQSCAIRLPVSLECALVLELQKSEEHGSEVSVHRSASLNHLPAIWCRISIPPGYPYQQAPALAIGNVSSWLPSWKLDEISKELVQIWDSFKDAVIFSYIDYIRSNSESGFGVFRDNKIVVDDEENFKFLVEENEKEEKVIFNNSTFTCEICQSEHKGLHTTRFPDCGDVFCDTCLSSYFVHTIKRGDIGSIHCPSVSCTQLHQKQLKELYSAAESRMISDFEGFNNKFFKLPLEDHFLERIISKGPPSSSSTLELIERYRDLHYRSTMEAYKALFPERVTGCPRPLCARVFLKDSPDTKLAICPKCKFAFCVDCYHSWHGANNPCSSIMKQLPRRVIETWLSHHGHESHLQSDEDRRVCSNIAFKYGKRRVELAVGDFIAQEQFEDLVRSGEADIVQCPKCAIFTQRSDGCNKMTCCNCQVFFCNICGDRLNQKDPYLHYNDPMSKCYGKLFENLISDEEAQ